ncbi:MAG: 2-oxoacid:ferredoxin oxidoreductase subunit gamma [Ruminococcaceae bacterium]|nr:2-oxoacid:ferredoxin oxidoreductase subunit gamma [Oscillospiraceae bacterium]
MSKSSSILFAGFGGQGVLFVGKFLAYKGLDEGKQVSWLPSYGPEMRGGTANCSVIISDDPIGSPIIDEPDILVAMNLPSLDKYEASVKKGGKIILDSSLIGRKVERDDVEVFYLPATQLANENNIPKLANMIIAGKLMKECDAVSYDNLREALAHVVSARHQDMLEVNLGAIEIGYNA